jgi:hypothetical protein
MSLIGVDYLEILLVQHDGMSDVTMIKRFFYSPSPFSMTMDGIGGTAG